MHQKYGPIVRISLSSCTLKTTIITMSFIPDRPEDGSVGLPHSSFSTAEYSHHRLRRGIIAPYLSKQAIRAFEVVIQQKANALSAHFKKACNNGAPIEFARIFCVICGRHSLTLRIQSTRLL
jgi:cytochrome P450